MPPFRFLSRCFFLCQIALLAACGVIVQTKDGKTSEIRSDQNLSASIPFLTTDSHSEAGQATTPQPSPVSSTIPDGASGEPSPASSPTPLVAAPPSPSPTPSASATPSPVPAQLSASPTPQAAASPLPPIVPVYQSTYFVDPGWIIDFLDSRNPNEGAPAYSLNTALGVVVSDPSSGAGVEFRGYASPTDKCQVALYRCAANIGGGIHHFLSTFQNCEGYSNQGVLVFGCATQLAGTLPLHRYFVAATGAHISTLSWDPNSLFAEPAGYSFAHEGFQGIYLFP